MIMRHRRSGLVLLPSLAFLLNAGCGGGDGAPAGAVDASVTPPPPGDGAAPVEIDAAPGDGSPALSRAAVLGALGTCALTTAREAAAAALSLEGAVKSHAGSPETRDVARANFAKALDAWQLVEA